MPLRTSELARNGGVNPQTLRYYEREGLLPEPPRLHSGYRVYPECCFTHSLHQAIAGARLYA